MSNKTSIRIVKMIGEISLIEKKKCFICGSEVIVLNCHYLFENCGFSENYHDLHHIINENE